MRKEVGHTEPERPSSEPRPTTSGTEVAANAATAASEAGPSSGASDAAAARDPFAAVWSLGERRSRIGTTVALVLALLLHGAGAARAAMTMVEVRSFASRVRARMVERLRTSYDIDLTPPEPPREPEPEAPREPEPEPAAPPPKAIKDTSPAPAAPPAAAEAAKVLTAAPDPNEPVDLTGEGFVTGTGDRYAGGVTTGAGTAKEAVYTRAARGGGGPPTPGGQAEGSGSGGKDLSRPPAPLTGDWNQCGFPAAAEIEQINFARVTLSVVVGPDGRARQAAVVKDPGYGFGPLAKGCALRMQYSAGLDRDGTPIAATRTFTVRFTR